MPNNDGTGPLGRGPMTGQSGGYCMLRFLANTCCPVDGYVGSDGKPLYFAKQQDALSMTDYGQKEVGKEGVEMPGGDRTGPVGMGPMTGRGAGLCGGVGAGRGMGPGRGFGLGRNRRGAFAGNAAVSASRDELEILKSEASAIKGALTGIQQRIDELEAQSEKE